MQRRLDEKAYGGIDQPSNYSQIEASTSPRATPRAFESLENLCSNSPLAGRKVVQMPPSPGKLPDYCFNFSVASIRLITFPPSRPRKGVKCLGYARGDVEASIWLVHYIIAKLNKIMLLTWMLCKMITGWSGSWWHRGHPEDSKSASSDRPSITCWPHDEILPKVYSTTHIQKFSRNKTESK